jgi:hypothetical protein
MRIIALVCAAAVSLAGGAAQSAQVAGGMGTAKCGELTNVYQGADMSLKQDFVIAIGEWAFGYMTGRNAQQAAANWKDLSVIDIDETALFIISQCQSYPAYYIGQIVDVIYDALPYASQSS